MEFQLYLFGNLHILQVTPFDSAKLLLLPLDERLVEDRY